MSKERKLKIWNISDWRFQGGYLYVAAHSQKAAVDLINEAYRKATGYSGAAMGSSHFRSHASANCWGNAMSSITPERGVWWSRSYSTPVERIL